MFKRPLLLIVLLLVVAALALVLANPHGANLGQILIGMVIAAVLIAPVWVKNRRTRNNLVSRMSAVGASRTSFVAGFAPGTAVPDSALKVGAPFPFNTASSRVGVAIDSTSIELWNGKYSEDRRPDVVVPKTDMRDIKVLSDDDQHTIWLRWESSSGEWKLGLIPLSLSSGFKRAVKEEEFASLVQALRTSTAPNT